MCWYSVAQSCLTLCDLMGNSPPRSSVHQISQVGILEWVAISFSTIESAMPFNHLILCHPLLLLPSIFPASGRVFSHESALFNLWPKYWRFSFNIIHFNEYLGLISFKIDWFDLLAIEGTAKSLPQLQSQNDQFFSSQSFLLSSSHIRA